MKKRLVGTYGGDVVRTVDACMFVFPDGTTTVWKKISTVAEAVQNGITLDMGNDAVLTHPGKRVIRLSNEKSADAYQADTLLDFLVAR